MKQNDAVLIIVISFVSGVLAFLLSTVLISNPQNRVQKVEVVEAIVADFPQPNKQYFNEGSIDPTGLIRIGENTNESPFNAN